MVSPPLVIGLFVVMFVVTVYHCSMGVAKRFPTNRTPFNLTLDNNNNNTIIIIIVIIVIVITNIA